MSNTINSPKAMFFDWDGTLVDSYALILAGHNYARENLGLKPFEAEEFRPYFGQPRDFIYDTHYPGAQAQARGYFEEFVTAHHTEYSNPMPGAKALLEYLHGTLQIPLGVISNKKAELLRQEVEALGWAPYFKAVTGSGDTEKDKPHPDPLLFTAAKAGAEADLGDVWYVGDTDVDLKAAAGAGCFFVLLRENALEIEEKPVLSLRNCEELLAFLLQTGENRLKRSV